jgi:hypothetical protein
MKMGEKAENLSKAIVQWIDKINKPVFWEKTRRIAEETGFTARQVGYVLGLMRMGLVDDIKVEWVGRSNGHSTWKFSKSDRRREGETQENGTR